MVRPPSPEEEDRRRLCRERKTLVAERIAHVNRIKGLLFAQGISDYEPRRRDRRERLEQLTTGDRRPLPAHLKAQISRELDRLELTLQQLKAVEAERDALLAPKGETAPAPVAALAGLRGIGPEFAAVLWLECFFRRFRQPAPGGGLCRAGADALAERIGRSRAGRIPVGKPELRSTMVQLAWLWLRHQPTSALSRWFKERVKTEWRPRPEGGNCRPGAQAARGAVEVCEQRRRDRGRGDEGRLSAATAASAFGRTLIRS
jgi:transposase